MVDHIQIHNVARSSYHWNELSSKNAQFLSIIWKNQIFLLNTRSNWKNFLHFEKTSRIIPKYIIFDTVK